MFNLYVNGIEPNLILLLADPTSFCLLKPVLFNAALVKVLCSQELIELL